MVTGSGSPSGLHRLYFLPIFDRDPLHVTLHVCEGRYVARSTPSVSMDDLRVRE